MKRFTVFALAFVVLTLGVSTAQAVIVFQDNLESYGSQAAFTTVWTPIGCQGQGASCTLNTTSTTSNELSQDFVSVLPDPAHLQTALNHSPVGSPGTSDSAERNQTTFAASPTLAIGDQLAYSFDFYDLAPTAAPFRAFANLQSSTAVGTSPPGQLLAMGLNNNQLASASGGNFYMARILGYTVPTGVGTDPDGGPDETAGGAGAFFKLNDFSTGAGTGPGARGTVAAWHNLKVIISTVDNVNTDYNFYVDGLRAEHVKLAGTPRTYVLLRMGAGVSSTQDAYYDNFLVEYTAGTPTSSADFNGDHVIDALDYVIWKKFNPIASGATQAKGDADGNGTNDPTDYTVWYNTYGGAAGAGSGLNGGNVPEPATLVMAMLAMAFGAGVRRR